MAGTKEINPQPRTPAQIALKRRLAANPLHTAPNPMEQYVHEAPASINDQNIQPSSLLHPVMKAEE